MAYDVDEPLRSVTDSTMLRWSIMGEVDALSLGRAPAPDDPADEE